MLGADDERAVIMAGGGGLREARPGLLILALAVFGRLFGFAGMMVAVPVAAAIGVLTRFALSKYLESPLYIGRPPAEP